MLVAVLAVSYGALSVYGAFALENITLPFRAAGLAVGVLLLVGGVLLFWKRASGVALLWVSAGVYALVVLVPAFQRHGSGAFSSLMGAFYVSLALRVAMAGVAHMALRACHTNKSVNTDLQR